MEQLFTDKEFCQRMKIDRATAYRWRDDGIVGYVKLPNGQVRYRQRDIDELWANFAKMDKLGLTLKDVESAIKSGVIDICVAKSRNHGGVAENATNFS
jgi:hypothetical protein